MSKEKTLIEKINEKFGEIQAIVQEDGNKDFAVFAVSTDGEKSSQLAVGSGSNINLAMCNAMSSNEVSYFAITSSSILFDCYRDNRSPEDVMKALSEMRPPSSLSDDLTTLKPETQA